MNYMTKKSLLIAIGLLITGYKAYAGIDMSALSKNNFILINKAGDDVYYAIKNNFALGDGATKLPKLKTAKLLEDEHYIAMAELKQNANTFILLISATKDGTSPVYLYTFPNGKTRVFLEIKSDVKSNLYIQPLPIKTPGKDETSHCIDLKPFPTKSFDDDDVITDPKNPKASGICLNVDGNITNGTKGVATTTIPTMDNKDPDGSIAKKLVDLEKPWYKPK